MSLPVGENEVIFSKTDLFEIAMARFIGGRSHFYSNSTTDRVVVAAIVAQERLFCAFFAGSIGATLIGVAFAPRPYPDLVPTVMGLSLWLG
jgi:hypothetical protein